MGLEVIWRSRPLDTERDERCIDPLGRSGDREFNQISSLLIVKNFLLSIDR